MRSIPLTLAALALGTTLALASPEVRVQATDGVARIELTGSYPRSRYTVYRGLDPGGAFQPVSQIDVLCIGSCFVEDPEVSAGATYWYRFDFTQPDGSRASYGPYAVTIPAILARRVGARVVPNPVRGTAGIEIYLAGGANAEPVRAEVRLYDLQGRMLKLLHAGPLGSGLNRMSWDGTDTAGRLTGPGAYFVTVRTPLGDARARLVRVR